MSRGNWGRVFSVVGGSEGGVEGVELELTEWRCLYGGGKYGYSVCFFFGFFFFFFGFFFFFLDFFLFVYLFVFY